MRAEGVLRLILNVSLYAGQTCLEDGKHVRTTVFEEGERRFVTFRVGHFRFLSGRQPLTTCRLARPRRQMSFARLSGSMSRLSRRHQRRQIRRSDQLGRVT